MPAPGGATLPPMEAAGCLEAELAMQLEQVKVWFGGKLAELQAENLHLKKQLGGSPNGDGGGAPRVQKVAGDLPRPNVSVEVRADVEARVGKQLTHKATMRHMPRILEHWTVKDEDDGETEKADDEDRNHHKKVGAAIEKYMNHRSIAVDDLTLQEHHEPGIFSRTLPLHPNSTVRVIWDCLAAIMLLSDFILIPLKVFNVASEGMATIGYVVLAYWTIDIPMQCLTAFFDGKGCLVTSYERIIKRYLVTWFVPDLLIVGTEYLMILVMQSRTGVASYGRIAKCMRAARVVRLLRLLRMAKLREFICKVEEVIDSEYVSILWGVVCNIIILLSMNHLCACLWYLVGTNDDESSWLIVYNLVDAPFKDRYLTSLHWSLTQFTPASMAVQPQNTAERLFAVVVLILAMVMFSSFVSSVTAGMTRLRNLQAQQVQDRYTLRKFLNAHSISHTLQARITRYVDIAVSTQKKHVPKAAVTLLKYLSMPLNVELLTEMYSPFLVAHPCFQRCLNHSMLGHLCCRAIENQSYSQRDRIFNSGRKATSFFMVKNGKMAYKVSDFASAGNQAAGKRTVMLESGSWFTEAALWTHWHHQGSMHAVSECSLVLIDSAKFGEVALSQTDAAVKSREYAREFLEGLQATVEEFGHAWDVPDAVMHASQEGVAHVHILETLLLGGDDSGSDE